jgi:hypothetical protein
MIQHGIFLTLKLCPLLRSQRRDPIGIISVKIIGKLNELTQITMGLNGLDIHGQSLQ